MPEFYSIAIYRAKEYKSAGIPVMPVIKGVKSTVIQIFFYTILFVISVIALTPYGYTGTTYFVIMGLMGAYWILLAVQGLMVMDSTKAAEAWARKMFRFSLIFLLAYSFMISIDWLLP
jgi:protoheme IX farnesyltransferase